MASQSESTLKSFVIDGSERSVQDIVSKLKFISKIKEDEVVDVTSLSLAEKGWATSAYRTYRAIIARDNESRDDTLEFFRQVTEKAFDLAGKYLTSNDVFYQEIGTMIINALQESKVGISNHAKTYKKDRMHVSKIETFITTLDTKSADLRRRVAIMREGVPVKQEQTAPVVQAVPVKQEKPTPAPRTAPVVYAPEAGAQPEQLGSSPPESIPDPEAMMRRRRKGRGTANENGEV